MVKKLTYLLIILMNLTVVGCTSNYNENLCDSDTMAILEDSLPVRTTESTIRMRADFNPKLKITKKIENSTLKELFFAEFKDKIIKASVHPGLKKRLQAEGAYSNGVVDLAKAGPISYIDIEYMEGKSGTAPASYYLNDARVFHESGERQCKDVPMESNLAKVFFMQDVRSFCEDNYSLVKQWCKEMDEKAEREKARKIEANQQKYL